MFLIRAQVTKSDFSLENFVLVPYKEQIGFGGGIGMMELAWENQIVAISFQLQVQ